MNIKKIILVLLIFGGINSSIYSQINTQNQNQNQYQNQNQNTYQNFQTNSQKINADYPSILSTFYTTPSSQTSPIEGAVDPEKYIIGPNDIFTLGIYGYMNQQIDLVVNIEGAVIIPTVGEININGNTLATAKEKITEAVKKRYFSSSVSFSLKVPRTFLVNLTGIVLGKYTVTSLTRASEMIKFLMLDSSNVSYKYFENMRKSSVEPEILRTQMSARNILIYRKDGTVKKVDMYKYYMTNDEKYNPYLLEGDLVKIPNTLIDKNYVTVSGAVQLGGAYEYNEDDDLETLIGLGRGMDAYAEPDSILLYRPRENNAGFDIYTLSYEKDKNFKINVYDRAFVKYKTDYKRMVTVLILGEVLRPGYYPVIYKTTKIKDVIEMAGGFKNSAYLPLSILFRFWDQEYTAKDSTEVYINQRASDLLITENDKKNYLIDIKAKRNRVVVDFEKLFLQNDENENIILEDKDIIYINDNKNIVYVYGQVNNEGYVTFEPGKSAEYFIKKSGGFGLAADESNTRIIRFNTRGWYKSDESEVKSGDYIYVPKKDYKTFGDVVQIISQVAGVVLGVITTYILIQNSTK